MSRVSSTRMVPSSPVHTTSQEQVSYDGIDYNIVREGLAEILNPVQAQASQGNARGNDREKFQAQSVFYNPIQQFNRDLSVLAIRVFAEQLVDIRNQDQKKGKRKSVLEKANKRRKLEASEGESSKLPKNQDVTEEPAREIDNKEPETAASKIDTEMLDASLLDDQIDLTNDIIANGNGDSISSIPKIPETTTTEEARHKIRVLDALSASGLRALRYAQEISVLTHVIANDLSASATKAIRLNVQHNKQEAKISLNTGDAIDFMHKSRGKFEVVDLDPYGTAGPFLDAALQSVVNGGLLCVTCTDSAVFASAGYSEKTFANYGGMPVKGPHSHEGGIRLLLNAIATSAARYGLAIEPLLSLSIDFYIRVFVKIRKSAQEVKFLAGKTMIVYGCDSGCGAWTTQPLARIKENINKIGTSYFGHSLAQAPSTNIACEHCGSKSHLHGPMWAGPIHNPYFIQSMLDNLENLSNDTYGTKARMKGMLITARDEILLPTPIPTEPSTSERIPPHIIDKHPFFFLPSMTSSILHCSAPSSAQFRGALLHLGYRVTRSHCKAGSIKTDAPWEVIWEIMREWIRQERPIKEDSIKPASPACLILDKRRENRNSLSELRDELKVLGEDRTAEKQDIKTKLESMLFRLSNTGSDDENIDGVEENGAAAAEKKLPVHKLKIIFDEALGKKSEEKQGEKIVRYQPNPRANWGPMTRAKG